MKILSGLSLVMALFLTTCMSVARDTVNGSGNVKTEVRNISGFDKILNKSSVNVFITKGNEFSVKVEADDNLIPYIITEVKNQSLSIRIDNDVNIRSSKNMNVYLTLPEVKEVAVLGSGDISSNDRFAGSAIEVSVKGSGNIRFAFDGDKADISIKGSGEIKFDGNIAHSILGIYGSGNLTMQTQGSDASCSIRGSGNINLSGTTKAIDVVVQGSGDVDATKFATQAADITIQGSGNCKVNVAESINVAIKGSGDVYYAGNPSKVSCKSLGSGKVKHL